MTHRIVGPEPAQHQHRLQKKAEKISFFDTQFWQFYIACIQTVTPAIKSRKNIFLRFFSLRFSFQNDMQLLSNSMSEMIGMAYSLHSYFLTSKTTIL